jgi:hypothetical protein
MGKGNPGCSGNHLQNGTEEKQIVNKKFRKGQPHFGCPFLLHEQETFGVYEPF